MSDNAPPFVLRLGREEGTGLDFSLNYIGINTRATPDCSITTAVRFHLRQHQREWQQDQRRVHSHGGSQLHWAGIEPAHAELPLRVMDTLKINLLHIPLTAEKGGLKGRGRVGVYC